MSKYEETEAESYFNHPDVVHALAGPLERAFTNSIVHAIALQQHEKAFA